ncbi:hypothetical protein ACWF50_11550 [Brucella pseudogrignonensis]
MSCVLLILDTALAYSRLIFIHGQSAGSICGLRPSQWKKFYLSLRIPTYSNNKWIHDRAFTAICEVADISL